MSIKGFVPARPSSISTKSRVSLYTPFCLPSLTSPFNHPKPPFIMKGSASIASITALVMFVASTQVEPVDGSFVVSVHNNPAFKPNATHQIIKTWRKFNHLPRSYSRFSEYAATIPLVDSRHDVEYYGIVKVGTPGVNFKLDFDTGSSDMWFPYTGCDTSCKGKTSYNPKKSKTYKKDGRAWSITYGDGSSSSGILAKDTVNIGGLTIKGQTIELAKKISPSFSADPIDGLVGLAFDSITTVSGTKTPVDNLISQKLIKEPIFGVFLGKASNGGGGEYVFGGYDKKKVGGKLTNVPVDKSSGYWEITVSSLTAGSKKDSGSFRAIVDTGTTLLLLTYSVAATLAKQLHATDNGDGTYNINCKASKLVDLELTIAGAKFKIPAADLIFEKNSDGTCLAGFGYSDLNFAILGDVFIKNNYVIFNQAVPRLQIAPLAGL